MAAHKPVQLAQALGDQNTDKRLEILRLVGESGSISEAGRRAGVSYKAAWQAVDTLSNLAGADLVERVVGGAGGGGARLSAAGQQLLHAAGRLDAARQRVLAELALAPGGPSPVGWEALGLRTSMRNQLPCVVAALRPERGAVSVCLRTTEGVVLWSRVTRESVQLLGLNRGLAVLALFKATAVSVVRGAPGAVADGTNRLPGEVVRVGRRSAGGNELALRLPGGLRVVGFADAGAAWRVGDAACAQLEASAVVIALRG